MKSDDPRLTAYALGELSPRESHAVKKEIEANPALQQEVDDIRAFEALFGEKHKLTPEQRAAVFQFGAGEDTVVDFPQKPRVSRVAVLLAAAAAVVISLTVLRAPTVTPDGAVAVDWSDWSDAQMLEHRALNTQPWKSAVEGELKPVAAAGAKALEVNAAAFRAEVKERAFKKTRAEVFEETTLPREKWLEVQSAPLSRVPLLAGNASLTWIEKSLQKGKLPHVSLVREEELLNVSVPSLQPDMVVQGVAGGVELVRAPWSSSELLAFVRVAGNSGERVQAALEFSENVKSYRVLGYSAGGSAPEFPAEQVMEHAHLAVYALQLVGHPMSNSDAVLSLELQVRTDLGRESDSLKVLYSAPHWSAVPHADLRHSLLVTTWAQWLKNPNNGGLKQVLLEQVASAVPSRADQQHTLKLIEQSLKLPL